MGLSVCVYMSMCSLVCACMCESSNVCGSVEAVVDHVKVRGQLLMLQIIIFSCTCTYQNISVYIRRTFIYLNKFCQS